MTVKSLCYVGVLAIGSIFISSCSKSDTLVKENGLEQDYKNSGLQNQPAVVAKVAPTRKAKQLIITDPETGQQQVFYDCREAGSTCDVGENPPPPPPSNGKIGNFQNEIRNVTIDKAYHQQSEKIEQMFSENREQLQDIFPNFYAENIQAGIKNKKLKYISNESFIAVVENTNQQTPVFVYLSRKNSFQSKVAPGDTTKTKVAKINTETGVVECKEPGSNCATRLANNFNVSHNDYLQLFENEFKNNKLRETILTNSYKVYETNSYIKLVPTNQVGETFYVLK
jgi:hypothetical protein